MDKKQISRLNTAMMLIETAAEDGASKFGTPSDYAWAAHSYIQYALNGIHSWDGAAPMARAILVASGSDMVDQILAE